MSDPLDKLPPKRRAFVLAYIGEAMANGAEAARIAGYAHPRHEASRLLADADVAAALESVNEEQVRGSIASAEECQEYLTRVIRGEEGDVVISKEDGLPMLDPDNPKRVLVVPAPTQHRIKAVDQLGKMRGYHAPKKVEHRELRDAPPHVLLARIAELHRRLESEVQGEIIEPNALEEGNDDDE